MVGLGLGMGLSRGRRSVYAPTHAATLLLVDGDTDWSGDTLRALDAYFGAVESRRASGLWLDWLVCGPDATRAARAVEWSGGTPSLRTLTLVNFVLPDDYTETGPGGGLDFKGTGSRRVTNTGRTMLAASTPIGDTSLAGYVTAVSGSGSVVPTLVGAHSGSAVKTLVYPNGPTTIVQFGLSSTEIYTTGGTVPGHVLGSATSATVQKIFNDGVEAANNTTSRTDPNLSTAIIIGARSNDLTRVIPAVLGAVVIGPGLSDAAAAAEAAACEAFQTALGRAA